MRQIRTPTKKKPAMFATTNLEQKQDLVHMKLSKLLSQRQMLNTSHIPKKHAHTLITNFKYLQSVQKFIKSLHFVEVENIFIQQEIVDDLSKEVQKYCEVYDPDEEAVMKFLETKKMFFQHHYDKALEGF
ncbi:unnamed protein product (macronuclear) [Paramecium tetraurelia]|uniref:Uncharacterized protein n=1 Tax=Paramecium tetraurelia TaxID=5888 RepID=A0DL10_PARTE|nr:uncharacterized protein GSPATT00018044001 [Paramecium tetraurelia]CAK83727.1 unnamed protein product [Paramecium tetraurelia]|eukprot:XP_001451124.1 hypothetical protein (macronuclear) [Paramecium tetraurelia strain d4-2]